MSDVFIFCDSNLILHMFWNRGRDFLRVQIAGCTRVSGIINRRAQLSAVKPWELSLDFIDRSKKAQFSHSETVVGCTAPMDAIAFLCNLLGAPGCRKLSTAASRSCQHRSLEDFSPKDLVKTIKSGKL
jgi:hypothetical protein